MTSSSARKFQSLTSCFTTSRCLKCRSLPYEQITASIPCNSNRSNESNHTLMKYSHAILTVLLMSSSVAPPACPNALWATAISPALKSCPAMAERKPNENQFETPA